MGWQLAVFFFALLCVFLNGFFVAAEFAIVRVRATRLEELRKRGHRLAKMSLKMVSRLDAYLSATQLGITMASLALGWLGEPAFATWLEPLLRSLGPWSQITAHTIALTCAFVLITFLHIVMGELAPKWLAIQQPERTLLWAILPMQLFYYAMFPLIFFFRHSAKLMLGLVGLKSSSESALAHSEEELRLLLAHSQKHGAIQAEERDLLERVFLYGDRNVHQIMVSRNEIIYLSAARPLSENIEIARQQEHSRYPLCEKDLDHVIGMVHLKDLLWRLREAGDSLDLRTLKRDILFVPETQPIRELMKEFQRRHIHMAVVVDEYGGTSGLVTLEDVVEELVGEIQDEFDEEAPKYLRNPDGSILVDGRLLIDEAETLLGTELSDQHNDTVGGHLLSLIGRRPRVGDIVRAGNYQARIADVKGLRISKIVFTPIAAEPEEG
ncbi:MAG TPA: hemolysin family protein, partial [Tepidisphaeraceae bacterium]|nr:hemolysin family protein [Tepidisphaeraceae bacterium]